MSKQFIRSEVKRILFALCSVIICGILLRGCISQYYESPDPPTLPPRITDPLKEDPDLYSARSVSSKQNDIGMDEYILRDVDLKSVFEPSDADNARVFYQIFVGSFSDSNSDGIGDLRGIIDRFSYLNDGDPDSGLSLGVEGIWLSPIFRSPSYHKYDVSNYYEIDPELGTMDDLRELVQLCHTRGVKIILDLPINHTSTSNLWFTKFSAAHKTGNTADPYYDFYSFNPTARLGSRMFYGIPGGDGCYEGNFSSDMPELNFDNEEVYRTVVDIARYYLTDIGVDGFRFDAAKYIYFGDEPRNISFWTRYMADLRSINPHIYTVAEVWDSDGVTTPYTVALNCFDFSMSQSEGKIAEAAKLGNVSKYTRYVASYLDSIHHVNPDAMILPFLSNHDMDRAAGYMTLASGYARVAANLYLLGPGSPFIYYGEEIGMKGSRGTANTDANRRLAMLWGDDDTVCDPQGATFEASKQTNGTVASQAGDGSSLYNHYKKLIALRRSNPEIAYGTYTALDLPDTKVGGFLAEQNGSIVAVFHNTTGSSQTIDLSAVCDHTFTTVRGYAGVGDATLEGSFLTIGEQTSVVIK